MRVRPPVASQAPPNTRSPRSPRLASWVCPNNSSQANGRFCRRPWVAHSVTPLVGCDQRTGCQVTWALPGTGPLRRAVPPETFSCCRAALCCQSRVTGSLICSCQVPGRTLSSALNWRVSTRACQRPSWARPPWAVVCNAKRRVACSAAPLRRRVKALSEPDTSACQSRKRQAWATGWSAGRRSSLGARSLASICSAWPCCCQPPAQRPVSSAPPCTAVVPSAFSSPGQRCTQREASAASSTLKRRSP